MNIGIEEAQKAHGLAVRARLMGKPKLTSKPIAPAENTIRDILCISTVSAKFMTASDWIVLQVSAAHNVTDHDMKSKRRNKPAVLARHEAMYRMRNETTMSLPLIGRKFGDRDHTTVLYGIRKHAERLAAQAASIEAVV